MAFWSIAIVGLDAGPGRIVRAGVGRAMLQLLVGASIAMTAIGVSDARYNDQQISLAASFTSNVRGASAGWAHTAESAMG